MKKHTITFLVVSICLAFFAFLVIGILQNHNSNFNKKTSVDNFITFQTENHCTLAFLPEHYSFDRIKYQVSDLSFQENIFSSERKIGQVLDLTNYEDQDTYFISISISSLPLPFSILRSDYDTDSTLLIEDVTIHYKNLKSQNDHDLSTLFTFQYRSHYYYGTLTYQSTTPRFTTNQQREAFFTNYLQQTFFQS